MWVSTLPICFMLLLVALPLRAQTSGTTRIYYIAADEVTWDYAPAGENIIAGRPFVGREEVWTRRGPTTIGTKYKKAVYREYTDSTFKTLRPRPAEWEHLGLMGPIIRGEVGDSIIVVFRNNGSYPFSMHPHGVFYDKDSEGAIYEDGTSGKDKTDDGVKPGGTHKYIWLAKDRAGPGPGEPSSSLWMYHSHVDESRDVNAGLIGPLLITARGKARPDGSPQDVDREIVMTFAEMDENLSWYIDDNIKSYALTPAKVQKSRGPPFVHPFGMTNLKQTMNGFIYGNGPSTMMNVGDRVRWYVMSTTNFEVHAPHWHGNVVTAQHMKTDVLNLGTMGMIVADMKVDNPGTWLFHCHIEPHMAAGVATRFVVGPAVASAAGGE